MPTFFVITLFAIMTPSLSIIVDLSSDFIIFLSYILFSKDPNDETITQESEKPVIEFNYTTDLPQVSSNCRIKTSEN